MRARRSCRCVEVDARAMRVSSSLSCSVSSNFVIGRDIDAHSGRAMPESTARIDVLYSHLRNGTLVLLAERTGLCEIVTSTASSSRFIDSGAKGDSTSCCPRTRGAAYGDSREGTIARQMPARRQHARCAFRLRSSPEFTIAAIRDGHALGAHLPRQTGVNVAGIEPDQIDEPRPSIDHRLLRRRYYNPY
jgi:hypothetical protein